MDKEDFISVSVGDPLKHNEGINAYVTYKVTTKTNMKQFDGGEFYVMRRYSDFVWLQEQLSLACPGIIIPPLPEKQVMGRFNESFLFQRQRSLEKFLARVAAHETLRSSSFFKLFLELESLENTKESLSQSNKRHDQSFWQWATAAGASIGNKMTGTSVVRLKTAEDAKVDDLREYINSLEPRMVSVHKASHALVDKGKEMAQALFDFGLAFTLLGQAESDALGDAMAQLGQCADKLSRIAAVEAEKETQFFEEPLGDYVRLVKQVKQALDVHADRLNAYETVLGEVDAKKQALASAQKKATANPALSPKVAAAEDELRRIKELSEDAKCEYDQVVVRVLAEVERFKKEKLIDFKAIILDYVQLQIEYNHQVEQSWREALPFLETLRTTNRPLQGGFPLRSATSERTEISTESQQDPPVESLSDMAPAAAENEEHVNNDEEEAPKPEEDIENGSEALVEEKVAEVEVIEADIDTGLNDVPE